MEVSTKLYSVTIRRRKKKTQKLNRVQIKHIFLCVISSNAVDRDDWLFIDLLFSALQKMPFNLLKIYLNSFDSRKEHTASMNEIWNTRYQYYNYNADSVGRTKHTFFNSILISIQMNSNDEINYKLWVDCNCVVDADTPSHSNRILSIDNQIN